MFVEGTKADCRGEMIFGSKVFSLLARILVITL